MRQVKVVGVRIDGMSSTYMFAEEVSMWSEQWVNVTDELHHILHCPKVGVLTAGPWALSRPHKAA